MMKGKIEMIAIPKFDINQISLLINDSNIDNNINIITKYNHDDASTKDELIELLDYLNNIKKYINRYNLSPFEICIFVNDLIRERPYKESENKTSRVSYSNDGKIYSIKNIENSRSITKVFKSDEIVCAGFSNLYSAILDLVGIKSDTLIYLSSEDSHSGHMSNLIYLYDKKYKMKGLYEIDTTWGRREKEDGTYDYQKSLNNYYFFARSLQQAIKIKEKNNL